MLNEFWQQFKSGTDIRGVAIDGVPGEPLNLTDDVVKRMAQGFALWLTKKAGKTPAQLTVSVGRDSRLSGPRLCQAVFQGLTEMGVRVLDCALASTPAMFMTTVDLHCDGAVQITASHHPYHRNGLKFFLPTGGVEGSDITAILELAQADAFEPADQPGTVEPVDYMTEYAAHLCAMVRAGVEAKDYAHPLAGFHIVVDAGNGVGGFYAKVLERLGADTSGSLYLEPDGRFPNHIPNPENEQAMACVCEATVKAGADFGIIFDTDVDRAGCVGADGREINRNRLVALAAAIVLEDQPGGTVVTDSVTSDGLKQFIEQTLHGKHRRFKRGYKNVINEAIRLNSEGVNAPLAIETSGHAALRENYFLDDGAYLATKILIKLAQLRAKGQTPDDLIAALQEPAESRELRFGITDPQFREAGARVLTQFEAFAKESGWRVADDSAEGVRVSFSEKQGDGWALLRVSVHDPVMPLNVESNRPGGCEEILAQIRPWIEAQPCLRAGKES